MKKLKNYLFQGATCLLVLFACTSTKTSSVDTKGASPMDSIDQSSKGGVLSNKEILSPSPTPEESGIDQGVEKQNRPSR